MQIALGAQHYVKYKELGVQLNGKHRALGKQLSAMKIRKNTKESQAQRELQGLHGEQVC